MTCLCLSQTLETENSYYMAMELCAGGDLMDRICEKKRLEEREVRRYIRQILSAVDHLHKHGIVHRLDYNRLDARFLLNLDIIYVIIIYRYFADARLHPYLCTVAVACWGQTHTHAETVHRAFTASKVGNSLRNGNVWHSALWEFLV